MNQAEARADGKETKIVSYTRRQEARTEGKVERKNIRKGKEREKDNIEVGRGKSNKEDKALLVERSASGP